jgi:hypothetical protein
VQLVYCFVVHLMVLESQVSLPRLGGAFERERRAGAMLASFCTNCRILAWDPMLRDADKANDRFYVEIK